MELCLENLWGLVAEAGWSLANAQVVCGQLGFRWKGYYGFTHCNYMYCDTMLSVTMKPVYILLFPCTDAQAVNNSHYGKPKKPVHLSHVYCTGSEEQILSCAHIELASLDEKKKLLNEVDVVGVICQSSSTSGNPTSAPNNAPGNPTMISTSSDQNTDGVIGELVSSVIPNYLIMFVLFMGLLMIIVLAIV